MITSYFPAPTAEGGTICSTRRSFCSPGFPSFIVFGPPVIPTITPEPQCGDLP